MLTVGRADPSLRHSVNTVVLVGCAAVVLVTTAMVGGSIDFAGTYVERPMILAEKGFAAKNLLAILNRNPIFLVVKKNLPATDVKGLKGTKLGMTRANISTRSLQRWTNSACISSRSDGTSSNPCAIRARWSFVT